MAKNDRLMEKFGGMRKPKNGFKTLMRLFGYYKHCQGLLICAVLSILVYSVATIYASYQMKPLINYLEASGITPNEAYAKFMAVLIGMGVLYLLGVITNYSLNRLMLSCSARVLQALRIDMFHHMQDMPIKYFDTHTHGELMSYYTNDVDAIREMLHHSITQMLISVISLVGVVAMMLVLSPKLFLIIIVMGFCVVGITKAVGKRSGSNFKAQQKAVSKVNGYIEEMIEGQKDVKVFTHEKKVVGDFDRLNEDLCVCATKANAYSNMIGPMMNNLSHIFYAIITAVGVLWLTGDGVGGVLVAFLQYIRQFSDRISQISQQFNFILLALAGAERIFEMLEEEVEVDEGCEHIGEMKGHIALEHVDFSYDGEKTVLHDVSLYAKPGQKIAFVGSTGAGKTTITNLLNRFYDVQKGVVTYDGVDIKKIPKKELRKSLGVVLQDTHLFTGTVMENIRYGNLEASDEECIKAAKIANAHYFISHLPEGYNTMLYSDGANLSQGQRQLIAIARAAVSNPRVLILDEATSSIDTRTEKLIEKGMDALMEGRTTFVIAHRLSTVRNANAIMVLEDGRIIERGDHEELLRQKGKYYQLYTGMFELT